MRKRKSSDGLTVQAIAGSNAVLLAFDLEAAARPGFRGFAIHRTDHTEEEAYWLTGMKTFAATNPGLAKGSRHSTRQQPIQDFCWSDYSAKPGHEYTYRVLALEGPPADLQPRAEVTVKVKTESPTAGDHDVYFNRGAAASQEYARRFGNRRPGEEGGNDDPAFAWLSRGAHEAILDFIARAKDGSFGLRVGAYEFRLPSVLEACREAHLRDADVQILYDAGKDFPRDENRAEALKAKIKSLCSERVPKPQALSHNKFIVLLENGTAKAVLTGSTNFSEGGVFGQSNVVHIVEDPTVAAAYLAYWEAMEGNPHKNDLAPVLTADHPLAAGKPPKGTSGVFSPRTSLDALNYYAALASGAQDALFMTFAFGMNDVFKDVYRNGQAPLRYALMEKLLGPGVKTEDKEAATQEMLDLRFMKENLFAVGSQLSFGDLDLWLGEKLTGLNTHVKYIHTKFLLIDPLGSDPIVVTGSANFSAASTNKNDENMLLIRGNKRVAEIYLTEYMRLWEHYAFREWATRNRGKQEVTTFGHLSTEDWWLKYFGDTALSRKRAYFVG